MKRIFVASILFSSLALPAAAVASQPAKDDGSAPTPVRPISTGVTAPQILRSTDIQVSPEVAAALRGDSTVVLQLNLDQQGKPADIQVVKSINPTLDADVVDAVRQFRWTPATLNKLPVSTDLTLNVVVQR
jgi:TonB family protein